MAKTNSVLRSVGIVASFALLTGFVAMTRATSGATAAPSALTSTFELEGDALDDPQVAGADWDRVWRDATSGGTTTESGARTVLFLRDGEPGDDDVISGGRDSEPLSSWSWKVGRASGKTDVQHLFAAAYQVADAGTYLYAGLDRTATEGVSSVGFWFFRDDVALLPGGGVGGRHLSGDLLVLVSFTQGGRVEQVDVYRWVGAGGSDGSLDLVATGAECGTTAGSSVCAVTNAPAPVTVPWDFQGRRGAPGVLSEQGLVEVGLDLGALLEPDGGCLSTFAAGTRTSKALDASLADIVLGRFSLCSATVEVTGTALSKVGDPATTTVTLANTGASPLVLRSVRDTALGDLLAPTSGVTVSSTCPATLDAWSRCTLDVAFTVPSTAPDPFTRTVTATFSLGGSAGETLAASGSHTMELFQPSIELTASGPPSGPAGATVLLDVGLLNTSSADSPALACTVISTNLGFSASTTLVSGGTARWSAPATLPTVAGAVLATKVGATCSPVGFPNVIASDARVAVAVLPVVERGLAVEPPRVDLGTIVVPGSVATTVVVRNTGEVAEQVVDVALGGDTMGFAVLSDGCRGATVPAGATCSLKLGYSPSRAGASSATLTIVAASGTTASGSLAGTGTVVVPVPFVALDKTGPSSARAGGTVEYRVVATDLSPVGAPSPLTCRVTDDLLGLSASAVLQPAQPSSWVLTFDVPSTLTGTLANLATVTCTAPGLNGMVGDVAVWTTEVVPPPRRAIAVEPVAIDVGTVVVPGSVDRGVSVTNTGDEVEELAALSISGSGAAAFDLRADTCAGAALRPGASCKASIVFTALAEGTYPATIQARTISGRTVTATLLGRGVEPPPPAPSVELDKTAPATALAGSGVVYLFAVANTGGRELACRLYDAQLGLDGAALATLPVSASTVVAFSWTVPAGSSGPLMNVASVRCRAADVDASVSDTDDAVVEVVPPGSRALAVVPAVLHLGEVVVPGTASTQVTVRNVGQEAEELTGLAVDPPSGTFTVLQGCGAGTVLEVGGACTATILFTPPASGPFTAVLRSAATSGASASATVTGAGRAVTPPTPRVGLEKTGPTTARVGDRVEYRFDVANLGDPGAGSLTCELLDPMLGVFERPVVVPEGEAGTRTHAFVVPPGAAGELVNVASVWCKAPGVTAAVVATDTSTLTIVQGPVRALAIEPALVDLGTVVAGGAVATQVSVRNTGEAAETLVAVTIDGAGEFVVLDGCGSGTSLPVGATCTLTVRFSPTGAGASSASLRASSASGASASATLLGAGEVPEPVPPVVQLAKTGPATGAAGATVTYELRLVDASPAEAAGPLVCTVVDPSLGYRSEPIALVRGVPVTRPVTASLPALPGAVVVNVAAASCTAPGTAPIGDVARWTVAVAPLRPERSLALEPAAVDVGEIEAPGSTVAHALVRNTGTATETVAIVEVAPAGTPFTAAGCLGAELVPQGACTLTVTYTVEQPGTHVATLVVTSAAGTTTGGTLTGRAVSVPPGPSVTLSKTGPATAMRGSTIEFAITATVSAPTTLRCTLVDTLLDVVAPVVLVPGQAATRAFAYTVPTTARTPLVNTAVITCTVPGSPVGVDATATAVVDLVEPHRSLVIVPSAVDLGVVYLPGSAVRSAAVVNTGDLDETVSSVVLLPGADARADGLALDTAACDGARLAPGASCPLTVRFTPSSPGARRATVQVTARSSAAASATVSALALLPPVPTPSIAFTKVVWPQTARPGQVVEYRFEVVNTSPAGAPAPLSCWMEDELLGVSARSLGVLAIGQSQAVTLAFALPQAAAARVTNHARVTCLAPNASDVQASATATVEVSPPARAIALRPTPVEFGTVLVGGRDVRFATLTNEGGQAETITAISVTGERVAPTEPGRARVAAQASPAPWFSVLSPAPAGQCLVGRRLGPGESCTVGVVFEPASTGGRAAELTVLTAGGLEAAVPLLGEGAPNLGYSVTLAKTGPVSASVGASVRYTLTMRNTSPASPPLACTLTDPVAAVARSLTLAWGQTATTSVDLVLAAGSPDPFVNVAVLRCSAPGTSGGARAVASWSIDLVAPPPAALQLSITPPSGSFGDVTLGSSATLAFTVRNESRLSNRISAVALADVGGPGFQVVEDGCTSRTLRSGGTCALRVRFTPSQPVPVSARLVVTGAGGSAASAALTGAGALPSEPVRGFVITPAMVDFTPGAPAPVASLSAAVALQVRNIGTDPEQVTAVVVRGPGAGAFQVVADACTGSELASDGACLLSVRFAPSQALSSTASLTATGTLGSSASAELRGTAWFQPTVVFNPAVVTIGRVTTLFGRGFPANSSVTIRWASRLLTTRTDAAGSFALPVLVAHHDERMPHQAVVEPVPGLYGELKAPLLLQASPLGPMAVSDAPYGMGESLVART